MKLLTVGQIQEAVEMALAADDTSVVVAGAKIRDAASGAGPGTDLFIIQPLDMGIGDESIKRLTRYINFYLLEQAGLRCAWTYGTSGNGEYQPNIETECLTAGVRVVDDQLWCEEHAKWMEYQVHRGERHDAKTCDQCLAAVAGMEEL
jgi:hypothetical protein